METRRVPRRTKDNVEDDLRVQEGVYVRVSQISEKEPSYVKPYKQEAKF